jgi:hypothetical protein
VFIGNVALQQQDGRIPFKIFDLELTAPYTDETIPTVNIPVAEPEFTRIDVEIVTPTVYGLLFVNIPVELLYPRFVYVPE